MSNLKRHLKIKPNQDRDKVDAAIDETNRRYEAKLAMYQYPRTAQEWWNVLTEWWDELVAIWCKFIPEVTWKRQSLVEMRKRRDMTLEGYCHQAWSNAPDDGSIHAIPGWRILCDLCSEAEYCLYGDGSVIKVEEENESHKTN